MVLLGAATTGCAAHAENLLEDLFVIFVLGGMLGFQYPVVVGLVLGICFWVNPAFRPKLLQWLSLLAPAATYYFCQIFLGSRQDWSTPNAMSALTLFGVIVVVVACAAQRPAWLVVGSGLGVPLALGLWLYTPLGRIPLVD